MSKLKDIGGMLFGIFAFVIAGYAWILFHRLLHWWDS